MYFPITIIDCGYCDMKVYIVAQMCSTISNQSNITFPVMPSPWCLHSQSLCLPL